MKNAKGKSISDIYENWCQGGFSSILKYRSRSKQNYGKERIMIQFPDLNNKWTQEKMRCLLNSTSNSDSAN